MGLSYRRDIDGLRSLAILPVVLFHFSIPGFSGGFVGVDIFFVISGFLIGSILWAERSGTGSISLVNFYYRRFRRLAPAFFAMCITTGIIGYAILLPFEFYEFGKSLIAATFYLSNIFFYRGAGYFDTIAEEKFLLHTWSLSVEEQFYIFLPFFLIFFGGRRNLLFVLSWSFFLLSLIACIFLTPRDHNATFYLFPFRAWELFSGVLLAIHTAERREPLKLDSWASWMGFALVVLSITFMPAGPNFPGYLAIAPVLGTVLLLANGHDHNLINRLLSARVCVFIGLISYSLYLWHWPIATLSLYYREKYSGSAELLFWLGLTFVVSWFSWRYIEKPFRAAEKYSAWKIFSFVGAGSAVILTYGAVIYFKDGMPNRFIPPTRTHIDASQDFLQDFSRCRIQAEGPLAGIEVCPVGPDGRPSFLAWGDSHLRAFHEGLNLAAHEAQRSGLVIWRAGCPPLFSVVKIESAATRQEDEDCTTANKQIRDATRSIEGVTDILLIGRWSYYSRGKGIGADEHNTIQLLYEAAGNRLDGSQAYYAAVVDTVNELSSHGWEVSILRQVPEVPFYNSRMVARLLAHGQLRGKNEYEELIEIEKSRALSHRKLSEAPFARLLEENRIVWLDTWPSLCDSKTCSAVQDGQSLYFDNNHITNRGARFLSGVFSSFLK